MDAISFEIVYVAAEACFRKTLSAQQGTSLGQAIEHARRECSEFPEEAWAEPHFAVYGKRVEDLSRGLVAGDRIEILRPLPMEPSEARRRRTGARF